MNKKIKMIEKGILIGGNGAFNWYHWIIEILPKLYLSNKFLNEFNDYPLVLPDICKKHKNFKESLDFFNKKGREVLYFKIEDIVYAEKLLYIEDIVKSPFHLRNGNKPKLRDYSQNDNLLLNYAKEFSRYYESINYKISSYNHKKIFLARRNSVRKYNQEAIFEIVDKYGFKIIYCEDLDFSEQISLFSNAKYLVGPSGAAWTGMIFSYNKNLKCLSWLPDYLNQACTYSNLANLLNHDLKFIKIDSKYNLKKNFNFHYDYYYLNPTILEDEIKKMILF